MTKETGWAWRGLPAEFRPCTARWPRQLLWSGLSPDAHTAPEGPCLSYWSLGPGVLVRMLSLNLPQVPVAFQVWIWFLELWAHLGSGQTLGVPWEEEESLALGWRGAPVLGRWALSWPPEQTVARTPRPRLPGGLGRSCILSPGCRCVSSLCAGSPQSREAPAAVCRERLLPGPLPRGALPRKHSCIEGPERSKPTSAQEWGCGHDLTNHPDL